MLWDFIFGFIHDFILPTNIKASHICLPLYWKRYMGTCMMYMGTSWCTWGLSWCTWGLAWRTSRDTTYNVWHKYKRHTMYYVGCMTYNALHRMYDIHTLHMMYDICIECTAYNVLHIILCITYTHVDIRVLYRRPYHNVL